MKHMRQLYPLCLLLLGLLASGFPMASHAAEVQSQVLVQPGSGEMPLMPYLDFYIDESLTMDIEEAAAPGLAASYKPFSPENLPRAEGTTWLRFTISPLPPETRPATFLLDMGQSIPGRPTLFDPEKNELSGALEWHENFPAHRNILLLPEEGPQPVTCYIKLDGLPGPWFAPTIRTPQNAASNLLGLSRTGAILALAVVMMLCLLRGASEKGQWRIWTGLYVGVALLQALIGMPEITQNFVIQTLAAVLLPGIALMLLPHVGRHLLNTPHLSRNLDIQLFLLSLPGAALALLPLIPGWDWLDRWLELWPVATIIFLPTALGAWIGGLTGAKRFLLACLLPPLFTACAWGGLDFGFPANFLASLPLWGVAISAILLVTGSSNDRGSRKNDRQEAQGAMGGAQKENVINLENPLGDPHLRLVSPPEPEPVKDNSLEIPELASEKEEELDWLQARENALREPLDEILRQSAALGECSLPPAVRQYAEQMIAAACHMADVMAGTLPVRPAENESQNPEKPFNLQHLLRQVHNSVASGAETTGTALSWYMPPHLCRMFKGEQEELKTTLSMLLESAVRASRNGSVHLAARRVPESADEGHLLFTITDNGAGVPPKERSTLAIAKAWELIGRMGGYLALEAAPSGVSVALSIRLEPVPNKEESEVPQSCGLILAGDDADERRALLKILADLPCRIRQAGSMTEVIEAQQAEPVPLLMATGKMAMPSSADMTRKFSQLASKAGYASSNILAITADDSQWDLLKPSGFTHAMIRSTDADSIKKTVADLLNNLAAANPDLPENKPAKEADENVEADRDLAPPDDAPQMEESISGKIEEESRDAGAHASPWEIPHPARTVPAAQNDGVHAFEGPDWLNSLSGMEEESPDEDGDEKAAKSIHATHANMDASHEAENRQASDADFTEWVSEPVPVGESFSPHAGQAESSAIKESSSSRSAPLPENATDESRGKKASDGSLLDFVVGISTEDANLQMTGEEEQANGSGENLSGKEKDRPEASAPTSTVQNQQLDFKLQAVEKEEKEAPEPERNVDPLVTELVQKLDQGMDATRHAYLGQNCANVANATDEMASTAEKVGLRLLARMARCVERAARANDLAAIGDLLPELETAVERNRIALKQTAARP